MSSKRNYSPYQYHRGRRAREKDRCIACGTILKEGEWVIQKRAHSRNVRGSNLHLIALKTGHILHIEHLVDAKGNRIYDK